MSGPEPHVESAVDRTIREAVERGVFDDLPGKGRPLPGAGRIGPVDENWWVRGYLEREGLSGEALLPPSVRLRKELDRLDATVAAFVDERRVREHVEEVEARVVDHMRNPVGPRVPIRRPDPDAVVDRWRAARGRRGGAAAGPGPAEPVPDSPQAHRPGRRRWWDRLRRR